MSAEADAALDEIRAVTASIVYAEQTAAALRTQRNEMFRTAHAAGCTATSIAAAAHVNKSWVHQIVAAPKEQTP